MRIEDTIRKYIPLKGRPSAKGWFSLVCQVCNDHGNKGPRAGFKFSPDGEAMSYSCFNCKFTTDYHPNKPVSKRLKTLFESYYIPIDEYDKLRFKQLTQGSYKPVSLEKSETIMPPAMQMPSDFVLLDDVDSPWCEVAKEFLSVVKGIDYKSHPFRICLTPSHPSRAAWKNRLIIPVFHNNDLIYYQGRSLGDATPKYKNCSQSRDSVLFGFDKVLDRSDEPLFVVEGMFDAMSVGGVAIFENSLTSNQVVWLNRSTRPKIYVPDQFGDGHIGAQQALKQGWSISTPDIGDCKDINEAVVKYGKLYVMDTLRSSVSSGEDALIKLGVYCK